MDAALPVSGNPAVEAAAYDDPLNEFATMLRKNASDTLRGDMNSVKFRYAIEEIEEFAWEEDIKFSTFMAHPSIFETRLYEALWAKFETLLEEGNSPSQAFNEVRL